MKYGNIYTALIDYARNGLDTELEKEQAKALFTAYCIVEDIYVDTFECDWAINEIYAIAKPEMAEDDFYNYMVELIV